MWDGLNYELADKLQKLQNRTIIGLSPSVITRDFKQRQPGRRRERHRIRENPKSPLRMTGGEQVDVLRLDPTRV